MSRWDSWWAELSRLGSGWVCSQAVVCKAVKCIHHIGEEGGSDNLIHGGLAWIAFSEAVHTAARGVAEQDDHSSLRVPQAEPATVCVLSRGSDVSMERTT